MADSRSREPRRGERTDDLTGNIKSQEPKHGPGQKQQDAGKTPGAGSGQGPPPTQGAKERIQEGKEEAKTEAREMGQQLQRTAEERAGRWTEQASRQASSIAHALETAGHDLDEQGQPRFAHWSENAAAELNKVAGYLQKEDPRSILKDVEGLARRNPGAFVGGTFAAGLLLGRFLRSSDPKSERMLTEGRPRGG